MPEFWQKTTKRARETLAVWRQFLPLMTVGETNAGQHEADVAKLGELAQAREACLVEARLAKKNELAGFGFIKKLNLAVPKLIEGWFDEGHPLREALGPAYAIVPQSDPTNLRRARILIPIWTMTNAELSARKPGDTIVRDETGVEEFEKRVSGGYPALQQASAFADAALGLARSALRAQNRKVDRMNKRAYKKLKAEAMDDPALAELLDKQITRERTTRKKKAKGKAAASTP